MIFKQGVAYTHQFLMVLSSDHVSGATGKTVAVELGKNGATGTGAQFSPATEVDSVNLPGIYSILLSANDTNSLGELVIHATASGCDATDEVHQVQFQIFTDLVLNANGRAMIASAVQQNSTFTVPFIMTVNSVPTPGLTGFVAQRALAGGGFAPCANSVTEIASGWYRIILAPADTNSSVIELLITATTADNRNITLYTQP